MSPKEEGKGKENRESAQRKVDQVVSALSLTQGERQRLHHEITGNDYMDYQEILALAKSMFDPVNVQSSKGEKRRW
jgi:hypothetical protein